MSRKKNGENKSTQLILEVKIAIQKVYKYVIRSSRQIFDFILYN